MSWSHENVPGVLADESAEEKRPIRGPRLLFLSRKFRDALRGMLKELSGVWYGARSRRRKVA